MKIITTTDIKVLLGIIIILLIINAILLLTGGIYNLTYAHNGCAYKINKITGKTYAILEIRTPSGKDAFCETPVHPLSYFADK